jgi:hypothetical protein
MKFAVYRNLKTLVGYYLDDISNIDSAATFLNLKPWRDLIEDFYSTFIRRDLDLWRLLLIKNLDKLK